MFRPQPNQATPEVTAPAESPVDNAAPADTEVPVESGGIKEEDIQAHLDALPDEEKKFLATHLTPEFVRAIGLISGPQVAQYLDQFADKSKVLVPVPRQAAEKFIAEQKAQQEAPSAPQGGPVGMAPQAQAPVPAAPQAAPVAQAPTPTMMAPPR